MKESSWKKKANKDGITDDMIAQTLNYLKASGLNLALIINFGKSCLEYKGCCTKLICVYL